MTVTTATILYFSPTGTTRKIARAIADGLDADHTVFIDISREDARKKLDKEISSDIFIIGFPVYEERVPEIVSSTLCTISITPQPAAIFCVYGNVGFGISLKQMTGILTQRNLPVVSCGAFIGEHSFSTDLTPLAKGRPDKQDCEQARDYGREIRKSLAANETPHGLQPDSVPGHLPLMARILPKNSVKFFSKTPVINSACNHCMACEKLCPVGAIAKDLSIDESKCIRCFSCVKHCQRNGRSIAFKKKPIVHRVLAKWNRKQAQTETFFA